MGFDVDIGLCMTVKNEENRIEDCLGEIADLFAEIIVIDTGSTDRTIEILQDRFGITPLTGTLEEARCNTLADLRNAGFAQLKTPWQMCLDADERILASELKRVVGWSNAEDTHGFFSPWLTTLPSGRIVDDYKIALFRQGYGKRGLVHDNVQPALREAGSTAVWTDAFEILHYPEESKLPGKDEYYAWRLDRAIQDDPDWMRYYWFRGLLLLRMGRPEEASRDLERAFGSRSKMFPVECLNAGMGLAGLQAHAGDTAGAIRTVTDALHFHHAVAQDFEVVINFRIRPWFERALEALHDGDAERVVPYTFAHGGALGGS
jgi:glycosyltransferase involved in cell wall biosynthesis